MKISISKKNIILIIAGAINALLFVLLLFYLGQIAVIAQEGKEITRKIQEFKDAKKRVRNFDSSLVLKQDIEFRRKFPVESFDKSMDSLAAIKGFMQAAEGFGVGVVNYSPAKQRQGLTAGSTTLSLISFTVKFSCEYRKAIELLQKVSQLNPQMTVRKVAMKRKPGNLAYVDLDMNIDSYLLPEGKK